MPKDNIALVAEFMTAMEQPVSQGFTEDGLELGMELIEEEFWELDDATAKVMRNPYIIENRENFVKELADLLYVVYWLAARVGVDVDKALKIVHSSNMSKLGDDGKPIKRADGKVLKGPNYKPPKMDSVAEAIPIALR